MHAVDGQTSCSAKTLRERTWGEAKLNLSTQIASVRSQTRRMRVNYKVNRSPRCEGLGGAPGETVVRCPVGSAGGVIIRGGKKSTRSAGTNGSVEVGHGIYSTRRLLNFRVLFRLSTGK